MLSLLKYLAPFTILRYNLYAELCDKPIRSCKYQLGDFYIKSSTLGRNKFTYADHS